jgi:hypothetical protein
VRSLRPAERIVVLWSDRALRSDDVVGRLLLLRHVGWEQDDLAAERHSNVSKNTFAEPLRGQARGTATVQSRGGGSATRSSGVKGPRVPGRARNITNGFGVNPDRATFSLGDSRV